MALGNTPAVARSSYNDPPRDHPVEDDVVIDVPDASSQPAVPMRIDGDEVIVELPTDVKLAFPDMSTSRSAGSAARTDGLRVLDAAMPIVKDDLPITVDAGVLHGRAGGRLLGRELSLRLTVLVLVGPCPVVRHDVDEVRPGA